jgi:hypothetical protein
MTQEALKLALEKIQKYEKETGEKLTLRANKLVLEPDELTIAYMSGLYDGKKAQRTWVGLTADEQSFVFDQVKQIVDSKPFWVRFADAVEAKLKEKNT